MAPSDGEGIENHAGRTASRDPESAPLRAVSATFALVPSPGSEGDVLMTVSDHRTQVLAPPGVAVWHGEAPEERHGWRWGTWDMGPSEQPLLEVHEPTHIDRLSTGEILELLPRRHVSFARRALALQLMQAQAFGRPSATRPTIEERVRRNGAVAAAMRDELELSFPGERWHAFRGDAPMPAIPDTAAELLALIATSSDTAVDTGSPAGGPGGRRSRRRVWRSALGATLRRLLRRSARRLSRRRTRGHKSAVSSGDHEDSLEVTGATLPL